MNIHRTIVAGLTKTAKKKKMRAESSEEQQRRIEKGYSGLGGALGSLVGLGYGLSRTGLRGAATKKGWKTLGLLGVSGGAAGALLGKHLGESASSIADYKELDPRRKMKRITRMERIKDWLKYGPS